MAIDFPSSPANGASFTSGGVTWVYNSAKGAWTTSMSGSLGAHTHTFASLTSKPTTIGGYGITGGTFSALVTTLASASGGAGFNLPHGAAPSSPVNGDIWSTTTKFSIQMNGTTKDVLFRDEIPGWVLLETITLASPQTDVTFALIANAAQYCELMVTGTNVSMSGAVGMAMTYSEDGGSSYGTVSLSANAIASNIHAGKWFFKETNLWAVPREYARRVWDQTGGASLDSNSGYYIASAGSAPINRIRMKGANFSTGTFKLYGKPGVIA